MGDQLIAPAPAACCNASNDPRVPLDMVFYAGRVTDFGPFVEALNGAARTCRGRPLTVLTGATGFAATRDYVTLLKSANATLVYATPSDSVAWG